MSPSGNWLAFQTGPAGQGLWRLALDGKHEPEELRGGSNGQTIGQIAIADDGHLLATPASWSGDLIALPARAGTRF